MGIVRGGITKAAPALVRSIVRAAPTPPPPAYSFTDVPGIIDYILASDTTRLKQDSGGSVAVTAVDDPIGYARGQLDVIEITQGNAGNKAKYAADGIYFLAGGTARKLHGAVTSIPAASAKTWFIRELQMSASQNTKLWGGFGSSSGFDFAAGMSHGHFDYNGNLWAVLRQNQTSAISGGGSLSGAHNIIVSQTGETSGSIWLDGVKYAVSGAASGASIVAGIGTYWTTGNCKAVVMGWSNAALTDGDVESLNALMDTY